MKKTYKSETGDVICSRCGAWIGNINGDGNYFALIRTKYCPACRAPAKRETDRLAQKAKRARDRREKQLMKSKCDLLEEENELLRNRIKKLRRNQYEEI